MENCSLTPEMSLAYKLSHVRAEQVCTAIITSKTRHCGSFEAKLEEFLNTDAFLSLEQLLYLEIPQAEFVYYEAAVMFFSVDTGRNSYK